MLSGPAHNGTQIANCLVSGYTYPAPKPAAARAPNQAEANYSAKVRQRQKMLPRIVRPFLRFPGGAVMIPRRPLKPGTYKVSVTAGGDSYRWSFKVASPSASPTLSPATQAVTNSQSPR